MATNYSNSQSRNTESKYGPGGYNQGRAQSHNNHTQAQRENAEAWARAAASRAERVTIKKRWSTMKFKKLPDSIRFNLNPLWDALSEENIEVIRDVKIAITDMVLTQTMNETEFICQVTVNRSNSVLEVTMGANHIIRTHNDRTLFIKAFVKSLKAFKNNNI